MKKEDIVVLAQLLSGMKDAVEVLNDARNKRDMEKISQAKREIKSFHEEISRLL